MKASEFYNSLKIDKSIAEKLNFNPYYINLNSGISGIVRIGQEYYYDLASNNYLGLSSDKRIIEVMQESLFKYGTSMCGTPIATGYLDKLNELEKRLASFIGLQDAIIFPSCYQANTGVFSSMASKDDLILVDHYAHSSLLQGIRSAGCKIKPFLHNNMNHLIKNLEKSSHFRKKFIVTESVFSTEGTIAPMDEISNICKHYDAIPVLDDSHGIGVIGKTGRGILEKQNILNFEGIYTASLGKALANIGGVIAGNSNLIDNLRYSCGNFIYSTAIPPVMICGLLKTIEILENEFTFLNLRLLNNKQKIINTLTSRGFKLHNGEAPIISIKCGSAENTIYSARQFFENRMLTTPFIPPSIPQNQGVLRLIPGAGLKENDITEIVKAINKIQALK
ncbi:MAG: pyridoxal phosphate-dependent aminotransferase family protein [Candidatus Aureabacteria bacterium]|nr:pyridoxal phosphate-dependent aminotransferase family protein [Candidatus Auribacterota bacterium]